MGVDNPEGRNRAAGESEAERQNPLSDSTPGVPDQAGPSETGSEAPGVPSEAPGVPEAREGPDASADGRGQAPEETSEEAAYQLPRQPSARDRSERGPRRGQSGGDGATAGSERGVPEQRRRRGVTRRGRSSRHATDEAHAPGETSDGELVRRMRTGDTDAYDLLYRRHAEAVRRYARSCCRDAHTAEDLTNEVFARTLQAVRGGSGPDTAVRAYLLTSVRRVAAAWSTRRQREQLVEDFALFVQATARAGTAPHDESLELGADVRAMQEAEQTLVVAAFRSLSEDEQLLLWHTTVEGAKPREVAPLVGKTPEATATAAHRARESLKQAYLQAHVSHARTTGGDCARFADRLGAYTRGGLRARAERGLRAHLEVCAECSKAAVEVRDLNEHIRVLVPVAVIGWFATSGGASALGALLAGTGAAGGAGVAAAATKAGAGAAAGGSGGAAAEGLGAPLKVGIASGVVVTAAGAALAMGLMGGDQQPSSRPESRPSAAPEAPSEQPPAEPSPRPEEPEEPEERPVPKPPTREEPTPRPSSPSPSPPSSEPEPSQPPESSPTPTPTPTEPPPESPEPTPPPREFRLNELKWVFHQHHKLDEPTVRIPASDWIWPRWGPHIAGTEYEHGVTVHASSSLTVDLNRECTRFHARAGVDDLSAGDRSVRFAVYGDGRQLWKSPTVEKGERPVPVRASLNEVDSVRLVVQPVEPPLDRVALVSWAESKLSC